MTPDLRLGHFAAMCDDVGLLQHAVFTVPDRAHGYCVDDNARALLLACGLGQAGAAQPIAPGRFAAFVQHAWNPDTGRFRNFFGYDRRWLEPRGSEDSHGRTLWALGVCARDGPDAPLRAWAADLFDRGLAAVETFTSPRAWAFTLLGADAACATGAADRQAIRIRDLLSERLLANLEAFERHEWRWFEPTLAYDNARLCEALIRTGLSVGSDRLRDGGLRSLAWLTSQQIALTGCFRPVGTQSFGVRWTAPRAFDQQPLEASATIGACLAADAAGAPGRWRAEAERAFAWFDGVNDLGVALVDPQTGACRDGLHPDRANGNCGAESVLAYLLAALDMATFARCGSRRPAGRAHEG